MPANDQGRINLIGEYEALSVSTLETKIDDTIRGLFSTQRLVVSIAVVILISLPYGLVLVVS